MFSNAFLLDKYSEAFIREGAYIRINMVNIAPDTAHFFNPKVLIVFLFLQENTCFREALLMSTHNMFLGR